MKENSRGIPLYGLLAIVGVAYFFTIALSLSGCGIAYGLGNFDSHAACMRAIGFGG